MFKLIFVICAIVAVALAGKQNFVQLREMCKTELNIPNESIEKLKNWNFDNNDHAACYMKCMFEKMGLFTNGHFNVDVIAQKLASEDKSADDLKPEIEKCIDNSITNDCQKVFNGFKCFKANNIYRIQTYTQQH